MAANDIQVRVSWGDLVVLVAYEGGYNPDVFDDMCRRAYGLWKHAYDDLMEGAPDDDDETAETAPGDGEA